MGSVVPIPYLNRTLAQCQQESVMSAFCFRLFLPNVDPEFVCVWGKTLFVLIWGFAKCTSKQVHSVTYHKYKSLWRGGHVAG